MKNLLAALALSTMLFLWLSSIAFADEAVCKTHHRLSLPTKQKAIRWMGEAQVSHCLWC